MLYCCTPNAFVVTEEGHSRKIEAYSKTNLKFDDNFCLLHLNYIRAIYMWSVRMKTWTCLAIVNVNVVFFHCVAIMRERESHGCVIKSDGQRVIWARISERNKFLSHADAFVNSHRFPRFQDIQFCKCHYDCLLVSSNTVHGTRNELRWINWLEIEMIQYSFSTSVVVSWTNWAWLTANNLIDDA